MAIQKGIIDVMDNFIPLISLLSSELEKKNKHDKRSEEYIVKILRGS